MVEPVRRFGQITSRVLGVLDRMIASADGEKFMRFLLLVIVFICLPSYGVEISSSEDAAEIMKDVVKTYNDIYSYRDNGQSTMVTGKDGYGKQIIQFTTLFDRNGRYSFS